VRIESKLPENQRLPVCLLSFIEVFCYCRLRDLLPSCILTNSLLRDFDMLLFVIWYDYQIIWTGAGVGAENCE
jgi:hypothetical protein